MKSLFDVMRKRGQPITGFPYIDGKEIDLYQLYQAVMANGGSEKVRSCLLPYSMLSSNKLIFEQ